MANIPTELLRTLVAVVELRSFTKAAQSLGVTQPAVSAQIKRLQGMLGTDLLDKSAPGVTLTSAGDMVVSYARRLLAINDQIVDVAMPKPNGQVLRIGATDDFTSADTARALARARVRRPDLRFLTASAPIDVLMHDLREGDVDLAIWASVAAPALDTPYSWTEEVVWLRGPDAVLQPQGAVPLVSYGEECVFTRTALAALRGAGRAGDLVLVSSSIAALGAAVAAGLGFMALPRCRAAVPGAVIWDHSPLPKMPDVVCGISVRAGADAADRAWIAQEIAQVLRVPASAVKDDNRALAAAG